jgi:hypothetical protein
MACGLKGLVDWPISPMRLFESPTVFFLTISGRVSLLPGNKSIVSRFLANWILLSIAVTTHGKSHRIMPHGYHHGYIEHGIKNKQMRIILAGWSLSGGIILNVLQNRDAKMENFST